MDYKILNDANKIVQKNTEKPENYLSVQPKAEKALIKCMKFLYNLAKEKTHNAGNALPELLVEDFDNEQIYQQIELQNEPAMTYFLTKCSKALVNKSQNPHSLQHLLMKQEEDENMEDENIKDENIEDSDNSISEEETKKRIENNSDDDEDEDNEDEDDEDDEEVKKSPGKKKSKKTSVVDDKFFKLDECEEFIVDAMRREKVEGKSQENSDSDESMDYFNDDDELEEEDEIDDGGKKKNDARYAKYGDFFDSPGKEEEEKENPGTKGTEENEVQLVVNGKDEFLYESNPAKLLEPFKKKVKFNLVEDSDDTDSIENKEAPEPETIDDEKSTFGQREERLKRRIQQLEEENMKEKPWQLKGEVGGLERPENALLEEYLETEVTARPAPIMTEQTTLTLEEVIKQRIKDKAFDDVEKKFKPVVTPLEYKKKLVLDQEKSKKSLAEIYESEYIKQKEARNVDENDDEPNVEEPKEHKEIREMTNALFNKLDALSNFHYTPKPINPEVKIISNLPVVAMEEVAPVATSDATLLAPEEIKAKARGDTMASEERTKTDKKRSRRRKKLRQGEIQKAKEARASLPSKPGKKTAQKEKAALVDKVSKARNVNKMSESVHKMAKSSTAFFEQLQNQAKMVARKPAKSAKKHDLSAVKLKL